MASDRDKASGDWTAQRDKAFEQFRDGYLSERDKANENPYEARLTPLPNRSLVYRLGVVGGTVGCVVSTNLVAISLWLAGAPHNDETFWYEHFYIALAALVLSAAVATTGFLYGKSQPS
jgi:hypothetical protein